MLILSNALANVTDEGCVKVANSLVKRIKEDCDNVFVVTFDRESELSDEHMSVNKLLLSRKLISRVSKHRGNVLYIPFPARSISTALRVFILSLFAGKNLRVLFSLTTQIGFVGKLLLRMSRARFIVLSKRSFDHYRGIVGDERVRYLKTGVDTDKFVPVSKERAKEIKKKYGFDADKKVILHVGHLNRGRNVEQLMKLSGKYQVLLVSSTLTKHEQDVGLKNELLSCGVRIIDSYIYNIEEIYNMADAYFFPVLEEGRCIDVPLSCMEAASCNKPIITTDFGEMKEFAGKNGFYFIDSFEKDALIELAENALGAENTDTRSAVMEYGWNNSIARLKD